MWQQNKSASWACMRDVQSPMSARVFSALLYLTLRAAEIIDWWFPVKKINKHS